MTLSPRDFEALAADLLSKHLGCRFEIFKPGKDSGIDLRHALSSDGSGAVIVQCKRYGTDKFSELVRNLRLELPKLELLQPTRYLVATTAGLSPLNKQKIARVLHPWIKSLEDIYGPDELNQLLRAYPEVVQQHFKLWISNTAVLERVLHARIFSQTEATIDATRRYASKLVVHEGLNNALDVLSKRHHVMIVGNPGIGKTTLARMLMCHYMEDGFEPVWIVGSVDDAWAAIHSVIGTTRKFVMVYDDFLGRLQFDVEKFGKNEDLSLLSLLDRAASLPNLRLILTTREYILADAKRLHGAFDARADDILKYTLSLAAYTNRERAQILFNHLYFSDLPDSRLKILVESGTCGDVIRHLHFNPRIVESVSNYANSRALADDQYLRFFKGEFDNPAKLWKWPFDREIGPVARQILVVLWSFSGQAEIGILEKSVRILNEMISGQNFSLRFEDALRQLEGNFIVSNRYLGIDRSEKFLVLEFQNPSVEEFVETMALDFHWIRDLVPACIAFDQIQKVFGWMRSRANRCTKELWLALRSVAERCEAVDGGRLVTHQEWSEFRPIRTWVCAQRNPAIVLHLLLQLEEIVQKNDTRHTYIQAHVLTPSGWEKLLAAVPGSSKSASAVLDLQRWIVRSSCWGLERIALSEKNLRQEILRLIAIDQAKPITISSLRSLIEAASLLERGFSPAQTAEIVDAIFRGKINAIEGYGDASFILQEAEAAKNLSRMLEVDLDSDIDSLREAARVRADENEVSIIQWQSERRRFTINSDEFDIQELFRGLVDR